MFFIASKVFWLIAAPSNLMTFFSVACPLFLVFGWRKWAAFSGAVALSILIVAGVFPTSVLLIRPLENRHARTPLPSKVDGVLVLSGGLAPAFYRERGVPTSESSITRLIAAVEIARQYPSARIVFSGGSGSLRRTDLSEADAARRLFVAMGLPPSRLTFEDKSRNTFESILLTKEIMAPDPKETWLLATSAIHMPRAMETANKLEWSFIPWVTDYLTLPSGGGSSSNVTGNLARTDYAVHEWLGLWAYRLSGKSRKMVGPVPHDEANPVRSPRLLPSNRV